MNKTAVTIAAALAALILISTAGLAYASHAQANLFQESSPASTQPASTDAQTLSSEKEAAYQAQIKEANRRLLEAQATQQALEQQIQTLQEQVQAQQNTQPFFGANEFSRRNNGFSRENENEGSFNLFGRDGDD